MKDQNQMKFGVRWVEFGRDDRAVMKERFFKTDAGRARFAEKLEEEEDNFARIESWHDPKGSE